MEVSFQNLVNGQRFFTEDVSQSLPKVHPQYITKELFELIYSMNQQHRENLRHIFFKAVWLPKMD